MKLIESGRGLDSFFIYIRMKFRMSSLAQDIKEKWMADSTAKSTTSARPDVQPAEKPSKKKGNDSAAASYERYITGISRAKDYPPGYFLG